MSARYRLPALLSFPLAALLAVAALGGILVPAVYAREHPSRAAQGVGQDWVDLVLVSPLLAAASYFTRKGSRLFTLLLAGTLAYVLYSMALYAFFMHFGPLFLVYAAALGVAFYALVGLVCALRGDDVRSWFGPGAPVRLAGAFAVLLGAGFSVLWLADLVPALAGGSVPASVKDSGLITNPVEMLDLGIVLPAFIISGLALIRRAPLGYWLGPMMLGFGVVEDAALIGMAISVRTQGGGAAGPPLLPLVAMTLVNAAVLALLLRYLRQDR